MMKVRVIYNSWFASMLGMNITLYPFIFLMVDHNTAIETNLLQHEWIHVGQIRTIGVVNFYSDYLWQWLKNIIKYRDLQKAYRSISYEVEAYSFQSIVILPEVIE